MCNRSPLFLPEAKSIIHELLKRTFELLDLSHHLMEYSRLDQYLSERKMNRNYPHFSLHKPCKLNYNLISDLDKYLTRLFTSCRLTKSHLRALYAARLTSPNDYIVIDDDISESIQRFQSKLNKLSPQFKPAMKSSDHLIYSRYHSQRQIHSSESIQTFVFHPKTSDDKNNSHTPISSDDISQSFEKISRLYQLLLQRLYGVHLVRDSDILQAIVIHVIRLLVSITNKLKGDLPSIKIHHRQHFTIRRNEEICQTKHSTKTQYNLIHEFET